MSQTRYLDLDAIPDEFAFTVKLNGKEHRVEASSVDDFIANARLIQSLGVSADPAEEMEGSIKILMRALPTADEGELRKLKLYQLDAIREFVMKANGELPDTGDVAADEDAEGNVAPVGSSKK